MNKLPRVTDKSVQKKITVYRGFILFVFGAKEMKKIAFNLLSKQ